MIVAFDTETYLVAPGRLAPPLVCLTWVQTEDIARNQWSEPQITRTPHDLVRGWLEDADCVLVGHNVAYDVAVLVQRWPDLWPLVWAAYDAGRILCTRVAEQLWAIEDGTLSYDHRTASRPDYSLAGLVKRHLGEEVEGKHGPDVWRLRYHELSDVALADWPAAARQYALLDAQYTGRVFGAQARRGLSPDLQQQCRAAWAFHLAGAWGIRTDAATVTELETRLRASVEDARGRLQARGLVRPDGSRDMKAIRTLVECAYLDAGRTVPTTEKGAVQTSAEVLQESGDPDLVALAEAAGDEKELSSFVPVLHNGTTRPINPRWRVLVESGRSSCSQPNLQNQPRRHGVRECYVPRAGNVFLSADYSIAELRALAQILLWRYGWSAMGDALRAGQDLHLVTAAGILGRTYDDVHEHRATAPVKQARQLAKAANFGFPGGLGAASFAAFARASYGLAIEEGDARTLKEQWLGRYPEMQQFFADVGRDCEASGGRFTADQYVSHRRRGQCGYTDGCNTYFQGLVADGAKAALYEVQRASYQPEGPLAGWRTVAFVHDELIVEGPELRATEAARELERLMAEAMSRYTPDIPVLVEAAAMRRWDKDAEPVWVDGRLVPWEDREVTQ